MTMRFLRALALLALVAGAAPACQDAHAGSAKWPDVVDFTKLLNVAVTVPLDLTATHSNVLLIPARPGYFPAMVGRNWIIESITGTLSTPPTVRAGSDGGHANFIASTATTPSAAEVNGTTSPTVAAGPGFPAATVTRIPNSAVYFDVTGAASGVGFAMTARLLVSYFWMPVP